MVGRIWNQDEELVLNMREFRLETTQAIYPLGVTFSLMKEFTSDAVAMWELINLDTSVGLLLFVDLPLLSVFLPRVWPPSSPSVLPSKNLNSVPAVLHLAALFSDPTNLCSCLLLPATVTANQLSGQSHPDSKNYNVFHVFDLSALSYSQRLYIP